MNVSPKQKKEPMYDWHPADILAALKKNGWSLRRLSIQAGLSPTTLNTALVRPWPKAEKIIASAIGVPPESIWPQRYAKRNFAPSFAQL